MNQKKALQTFERYFRARYPLVACVSHEETRVLAGIRSVAEAIGTKVYEWSYTTGLNLENVDSDTRNPAAALEAIMQTYNQSSDMHADLLPPAIFVFKDIHGFMGNKSRGFDPVLVRLLRDFAAWSEENQNSIAFISPAFDVPSDLDKVIALIDWPLPDSSELEEILSECERRLPSSVKRVLNGGTGNREKIVAALRGLTAFEAASVINAGVVATLELSDKIIPFIVDEKAQIIRKSGYLEFYPAGVTMNDVGGLSELKNYAAVKRNAFSAQARAAGVDSPKGVLLVGIPGTGKSLSAKAIAGGDMPLLRMDVGSLMGSLVGQSEGNTRGALKVAEAVAPCVLWIDEIEKGMAGASGENDGGTSVRVFGTILTWMQEMTAPVYVVATANDIRALKPELLRRFDDIFWVDLPASADRQQIAALHLARRGFRFEEIFPTVAQAEEFAAALHGFTGAEIEKIVRSAIETAFFDNVPLSGSYLLAAAGKTIGIAETMQNEISSLRAWAKSRARNAGVPLETKSAFAPQKSRSVNL
jgi:SpoVK/Ycf46/Vps4 family AAA+-type ATPase